MVTTLSSVGGSTDKEGEDGEFDFNLEIFKDDQMTSPIDKNHIVSVGDNLYFKLSQEYPVDGLIFSIDGNLPKRLSGAKNISRLLNLFLDCIVKDQESEQEYSIIKDQCPNDFVDAVLSSSSSKGLNHFKYINITVFAT